MAAALIESAAIDCDYLKRRVGRRTPLPPRYTASNGISLPIPPHLRVSCPCDSASNCAIENLVVFTQQLRPTLDQGVLRSQLNAQRKPNQRCNNISFVADNRLLERVEELYGLPTVRSRCRCAYIVGGLSAKGSASASSID